MRSTEMLFESTSGMPGHHPDVALPPDGSPSPSDESSPVSSGETSPETAVRLVWAWISGLIVSGLPAPRNVDISRDTRHAYLIFSAADDVRRWGEALGVTVQVHRNPSPGQRPSWLVSTEAEIRLGDTTVHLHHLRTNPIDGGLSSGASS
jgi:hypothetical protein